MLYQNSKLSRNTSTVQYYRAPRPPIRQQRLRGIPPRRYLIFFTEGARVLIHIGVPLYLCTAITVLYYMPAQSTHGKNEMYSNTVYTSALCDRVSALGTSMAVNFKENSTHEMISSYI